MNPAQFFFFRPERDQRHAQKLQTAKQQHFVGLKSPKKKKIAKKKQATVLLHQQWLTELTLFCGRKLHRHMER